MKTVLTVVRVLILGAAVSLQAAEAPTFAGQWKINLAKSDPGMMPLDAAYARRVTLEGNALTVAEEHGVGGDDATRAWAIGGEPTAFDVNGAHVLSAARWDGEALVVRSRIDAQGVEILTTVRMTLEDGGNTTKLAIDGETPVGPFIATLVFDRQ